MKNKLISILSLVIFMGLNISLKAMDNQTRAALLEEFGESSEDRRANIQKKIKALKETIKALRGSIVGLEWVDYKLGRYGLEMQSRRNIEIQKEIDENENKIAELEREYKSLAEDTN